MNKYLKLIRVHQYYKNLVVFIGLVLSQHLLNFNFVLLSLYAFFIMCLASSCIYIFNDIIDVEKDKLHPKKRFNPLPSGAIKKNVAGFIAMMFFVIILAVINILLLNNLLFSFIIATFFVINLLYSFILREIFLLDIFVIGFNFILRAVAGGVILPGVIITQWLIVITFLLALMLALSKRKAELHLAHNNKIAYRKVLDKYSEELINQFLSIVISSLLIAYTIYAVTHKYFLMVYTVPTIIYLLFRYLYIQNKINEERTEVILKDKYFLAGVIFWLFEIMVVYYVL